MGCTSCSRKRSSTKKSSPSRKVTVILKKKPKRSGKIIK